MELTDRNVWDVMRKLVSENNAQITRLYSISVAASVNSNQSLTAKQCTDYKRRLITTNMPLIYTALSDKFFERDQAGKERFFSLKQAKKDWQGQLDTVSLFHFYELQNRALNCFSEIKKVNAPALIQRIGLIKPNPYFTGRACFDGKPAMQRGAAKIDVSNAEVRAEAIKRASELAIEQGQRHLSSRQVPASSQTPVLQLGKGFEGAVADRYFEQRKQHQLSNDKFVGVDKDGSAVYQKGRTYYTHTSGVLGKNEEIFAPDTYQPLGTAGSGVSSFSYPEEEQIEEELVGNGTDPSTQATAEKIAEDSNDVKVKGGLEQVQSADKNSTTQNEEQHLPPEQLKLFDFDLLQ